MQDANGGLGVGRVLRLDAGGGPVEDEALDEPGGGEGLAAGLEGNGNREEDDGEGEMDGAGEAGGLQAHEAEIDGGEGEHEPGEGGVEAGVLEDGVEGEGEKGGVREGEEGVAEDGSGLLGGPIHRR